MKKRSKFSLSNYKLLSTKMGYIVPINLTEVLPGDSIQQSTGIFMRLAPMVAPVMHPVHLSVYHFYVPTRILWDDFEDFITGGPDGTNTSVPPQVTIKPVVRSVADHFGLPLGNEITVSALPFRAYFRIYNEFFRDQDLQAESDPGLHTGSGIIKPEIPEHYAGYQMVRPAWSKDYFTTARPWPSKGPGISIPINGITASISNGGDPFRLNGGFNDPDTVASLSGVTLSGSAGMVRWNANKDDVNLRYESGLHVDVNSQGAGIDVNTLRQAFSLQRMQEHRALFGSRYEDYLRYIGVRPQDSRLQNPEYLGGSSQTIQFSEVLQTGGDTVGQLYGHGIAAMRTNRYRRFIPEHGFIISLLAVRPIPVYTQGIDRLWSRQTKEDYWQKELQHIGQQEVLNQEVYADGSAADKNTFGYQNRYDEYRRGTNTVSGEFRTNQDYWHMARVFNSRPALNSDFVTCHPTDRIFQAQEQTSDQLYIMAQNNIVARRLVDKNGNPL